MRATVVEIANLGSWGAVTLLAEYDAQEDAIRIDARAVARVRAALGDAHAENFIACAIAHEGFHRDHPAASEAAARDFVRATFGAAPQRYEAVLRT